MTVDEDRIRERLADLAAAYEPSDGLYERVRGARPRASARPRLVVALVAVVALLAVALGLPQVLSDDGDERDRVITDDGTTDDGSIDDDRNRPVRPGWRAIADAPIEGRGSESVPGRAPSGSYGEAGSVPPTTRPSIAGASCRGRPCRGDPWRRRCGRAGRWSCGAATVPTRGRPGGARLMAPHTTR